jgi:hypothetical protein
MAETSELSTLHRTMDELGSVVGSVRTRYGDIPAVRRIVGDLERMALDVADLDALQPPAEPASAEPPRPALQPIDDRPLDSSLWVDADDEGIGGYRGPGAERTRGRDRHGRGAHRFGGQHTDAPGGEAAGGPQR